MKPFDKIFSNRVRQVFGSYNADHLAEQGWRAFKQKEKQTKRRVPIVVPLWAKAATVALLVGFGGILGYRLSVQLNLQQTEIAQEQTQSDIRSEEPLTATPKATQPNEKGIIYGKESKDSEPYSHPNQEATKSILYTEASENVDIPRKVKQNFTAQKVDSVNITLAKADVSHDTLQEQDYYQDTSMVGARVVLISSPLLDEAQPSLAYADNMDTGRPQPFTRSTTFGLGLAGMMPTSDARATVDPGMAVSLYSSHKLSSRINFRPGIALARLSVGINDAMAYNLFSSSTRESLDYGASQGGVTYESVVDFIALEIPLAFILNFSERANGRFFIAAGASSLVFLRQQFTDSYHFSDPALLGTVGNDYVLYDMEQHGDKLIEGSADYSSPSNSGSSSSQPEYSYTYDGANNLTIKSKYGAFRHADLFSLINLSAGYLLTLGDATLILEPFIQFPVSGVTSNNLYIGYGGIVIRYQL